MTDVHMHLGYHRQALNVLLPAVKIQRCKLPDREFRRANCQPSEADCQTGNRCPQKLNAATCQQRNPKDCPPRSPNGHTAKRGIQGRQWPKMESRRASCQLRNSVKWTTKPGIRRQPIFSDADCRPSLCSAMCITDVSAKMKSRPGCKSGSAMLWLRAD